MNRVPPPTGHTGNSGRIWIDLDNSPHVPFFRPIIERLRTKGFEVLLTARRCSQVCGLADKFKMEYSLIGRHHGKHKIVKLAGLFVRAMELMPLVMRETCSGALAWVQSPVHRRKHSWNSLNSGVGL